MKRLCFLSVALLVALTTISCNEDSLPEEPKDPVVETRDATDVTTTTVTLNARLEMNGAQYAALTCGFKWGTSESDLNGFLYGEKAENPYSVMLTDLLENTQYWFQAYAKVDDKEYLGKVSTFTTKLTPEGAVDLGIIMTRADGTKYNLFWAKSNLCDRGLCDNDTQDYGDFYAWGETESKTKFTWTEYKFGVESSLSKYNDEDKKNVLETGPEGDDAASKILGGNWRMPTDTEWKELITKCNWTEGMLRDIIGILGTAPNGNAIFLPFGGQRYFLSADDIDSCGYYWCSTLDHEDSNMGGIALFNYKEQKLIRASRAWGHSIRPVYEE